MLATDIISAVKTITDRFDSEVDVAMPLLISIVESKINLALEEVCPVRYTSLVAFLASSFTEFNSKVSVVKLADVLLPGGFFIAVRQLVINNRSLQFIPMAALLERPAGNFYSVANGSIYTSYANLLAIPSEDVSLIYVASVEPLATGNWVADLYPSVYITGLVAEVYGMVKDGEAALAYTELFKQQLAALKDEEFRGAAQGTQTQQRASEA
jgi:hypothetical protein